MDNLSLIFISKLYLILQSHLFGLTEWDVGSEQASNIKIYIKSFVKVDGSQLFITGLAAPDKAGIHPINLSSDLI